MAIKVGGNTGVVPPQVQDKAASNPAPSAPAARSATNEPVVSKSSAKAANLPPLPTKDLSPAAQLNAFKRSGYSTDDAKAAMQKFDFLKSGTVDEAKQYIGLKVLNGREQMLNDVGITREKWDDHEQMGAFKRSGYTTDDAKEAMRKFDFLKGGTVDDAKRYLGLKVINKYESMLEEAGITRAPFDDHELMGAFKRSGYSEDDAKAAMRKFDFLKDGTLDDAKRYIGLKVVNKYESMLEESGITPAPFDDHEQLAAFKRSGYTRSDAEQAMKKFDFLKDGTVQDAMRYLGLKKINGYEQMMTAAGITESHFDRHELMNAFEKSGYTTHNAHEAIKKFDFLKGSTVQQAKEYIGLKVMNHYEEMLRDAGILPGK